MINRKEIVRERNECAQEEKKPVCMGKKKEMAFD